MRKAASTGFPGIPEASLDISPALGKLSRDELAEEEKNLSVAWPRKSRFKSGLLLRAMPRFPGFPAIRVRERNAPRLGVYDPELGKVGCTQASSM